MIVDWDGDGSYAESDCNDGDDDVYPGAPETCGDSIDQDCHKLTIHGVDIETNNGEQFYSAYDILDDPANMDDFFDWVDTVHANYVGIYVAMQYKDAVDTDFTMTRHEDLADTGDPGEGMGTWTWDDDVLAQLTSLIKAHHVNNDPGQPLMKVYWVLTPEPLDDNGTPTLAADDIERDADRDMWGYTWAELGGTDDYSGEAYERGYTHAEWIWDDPTSSEVEDFWTNYTASAVALATEAASQGVDIFAMGAETNGLLRDKWVTESTDYDYLYNGVDGLFDQVRAVYSGQITFEQYWDDPEALPEDYAIWDEVPFDVIWFSMWLPLGSSSYEGEWDDVFDGPLSDLHAYYPSRKVAIGEFGYVDYLGSWAAPFAHDGETGVDIHDSDGEDSQAGAMDGFYASRDSHCGLIDGTFVWGNTTDLDSYYGDFAETYYTISPRDWVDSESTTHNEASLVLEDAYDGDWQ